MGRPKCLVIGGVLAGAALGALLFLGGTARAQDGPTPPKLSDPIGTNVAPHGGYSSTTNFCLQCHALHDGAEYALLWKDSVTATCNTCHALYGSGGSSTRDPVGPGTTGTVSGRSAYNVTSPAAQHSVGATSVPNDSGVTMKQSNWSYSGSWYTTNSSEAAGAGTASDIGGGLYCASCHSPHGSDGQVVNKWTKPNADGSVPGDEHKKFWWESWTGNPAGAGGWRYLDYDAANSAWRVCLADTDVVNGDGAGVEANCPYAQLKDAEGQLVSLYGYKLLSTGPNHQYAPVAIPDPDGDGPLLATSWNRKSYRAGEELKDANGAVAKSLSRSKDQMLWCGTCHQSKIDEGYGGTLHSHPTACFYCHGNPDAGVGTSTDFPHTSDTSRFLKNYPDALCNTCHLAPGKSLP